jgi:hypothetical protein
MEEAQEIAKLLREELRPFIPREIKAAIRERGFRPKAEVDALAREVYEEGAKWTTEVLESFWGELLYASSLGEGQGVGGKWKPGNLARMEEIWIDEVDSLQAMFGIEESLRNGAFVRMSCTFYEENEEEEGEGKVSVNVIDKEASEVTFPLPEPPPFSMEFYLEARVGFVDFVSRFRALNSRVYFMGTDPGHLEEGLKIARHLRSGFQAMGIDGLEEAIEALQVLKKGEAHSQGPYTLARTNKSWFLYRGPLLGEPGLDERLALGEPVTLSFPGGVEVSLKASFWEQEVRLDFLGIRFGGETLHFESLPWFSASFFSKSPVVGAIQAGLSAELRRMEQENRSSPLCEASPQALALVRFLAQHEDPFGVLTEGKLRPYITAEFFTDL